MEHRASRQEPGIAIVAGEVSGDLVGAALARELRRERPDLVLWGVGGHRMAEAGVELVQSSDRWGAIGVIEALRVYPELRLRVYPHLMAAIARRRPRAVVLIDFGAFNMKVARSCKGLGVPVLYYFPPGSWKKHGKAGPEIARVTARIATPFPWSAERLAAVGANVEFVGHPLLELARPSMTRAQFADRFGMEAGEPIVGLLPGSRNFEVRHNGPAMLGAAALIRSELPSVQFVFAAASPSAHRHIEASIDQWTRGLLGDLRPRTGVPGVRASLNRESGAHSRVRLVTPEGVTMTPEEFEGRFRARLKAQAPPGPGSLPPVVVVDGLAHDVMAHSDALLVCSGTATLEAAVLGTPMVILYRGSRLMQMEAWLRRVRPEHIGMPNIVAGERIAAEFLQDEASPVALATGVLKLLRDPAARARARESLRQVRAVLGAPGASARTARMVLEVAGLEPGDQERGRACTG